MRVCRSDRGWCHQSFPENVIHLPGIYALGQYTYITISGLIWSFFANAVRARRVLGDVKRAPELADAFERLDWIHALDRYAMQVNPLLGQEEVLNSMRYYCVTAQAEYSTDILFRKRADLEELMPRLCQYGMLYFGASDVMTFLGRKERIALGADGQWSGNKIGRMAP